MSVDVGGHEFAQTQGSVAEWVSGRIDGVFEHHEDGVGCWGGSHELLDPTKNKITTTEPKGRNHTLIF